MAAKRRFDPQLLGIVLLALLVVGLAVSWAWTQLAPRLSSHPKQPPGTVRIQVLNGSGEPGIGARVASYLREGGFQVVEVRSADRSDYFASMVIARRADLSSAREVAHYLGGPPLIQQAWSSELADISVLVGSDRSHLRLEP